MAHCSTLGVGMSYPGQKVESADTLVRAAGSSVPSSRGTITTTCTHMQHMHGGSQGTSQCSGATGPRHRRPRSEMGVVVPVLMEPSRVGRYTAARLQRYGGIARSIESVRGFVLV